MKFKTNGAAVSLTGTPETEVGSTPAMDLYQVTTVNFTLAGLTELNEHPIEPYTALKHSPWVDKLAASMLFPVGAPKETFRLYHRGDHEGEQRRSDPIPQRGGIGAERTSAFATRPPRAGRGRDPSRVARTGAATRS